MKNTNYYRQVISFGNRLFRDVFRCPASVNGRALLLFLKANWSKTLGWSASGLGATLILCGSVQQAEAALASYDFQTSLASTDTDTGSVAGDFGFLNLTGNRVTPTFGGTTSIDFTGGDTSATEALAVSNPNYFSFTITPTASHRLMLSGTAALTFSYGCQITMSAGFNWAVRSSLDSFAADIGTGTTTTLDTFLPGSVSLSSAFDSQDAAVTFRIYVWDNGEQGNSKLGYFDNVVLNGTVVAVPEPVNVALAVFGLCLAGVGVGRRYLLKRA